MRSVLCAILLAGSTIAATAADQEPIQVPDAVEVNDIILDLGLGAQLQPKFPGSKEYTVSPWPIGSLNFLRLPFLGDVADTRNIRVLSIHPSFNVEGERKAKDARYLAGTRDVDYGIEIGPAIAYRQGPVRGFIQARYGVTGSYGFVGEAGVDLVTTQFERFQVRAGPRVSMASANYMDTYFGVPDQATELKEFKPSGGFKDIGAEIQAFYRLTDKLTLRGKAEWTHYVGDAADSPIIKEGNQDEFVIGIGLSYLFGLNLY